MDAARAKGCGQVMAKGQFANALPKLLAVARCRLPRRSAVGKSGSSSRSERDDEIGRAPLGLLLGRQRRVREDERGRGSRRRGPARMSNL